MDNPSSPSLPPDPEDVDWFGTGIALLRDHGDRAVDLAAAILQTALGVMLRESDARIILGSETKKSPRRLAVQAIGAFETAGGVYTTLRALMTPARREAFDAALRAHARSLLEGHQSPPNTKTVAPST